jgi:hypothetical protein
MLGSGSGSCKSIKEFSLSGKIVVTWFDQVLTIENEIRNDSDSVPTYQGLLDQHCKCMVISSSRPRHVALVQAKDESVPSKKVNQKVNFDAILQLSNQSSAYDQASITTGVHSPCGGSVYRPSNSPYVKESLITPAT